jgi:glycosyltransferase involved in cell wall biosynthesis
MDKQILIVVPCFNEATRWNHEYWLSLSKISNLKFIFVNDGSTDNTKSKIEEFTHATPHMLLDLPKNCGKAEAVRLGFQEAIKLEPDAIGFLDADGAFPIEDVKIQLGVYCELNYDKNLVSIWSSRVKLAGRDIDRRMLRHYMARVISTFLSLRLKYTIYDTQSGMKLFPFNKPLVDTMSKKFSTRWFVDLEIYLRWRALNGEPLIIWEEPLRGWRDIGGSKLSGRQYLQVLRDIRFLLRYKGN